MPRHIALLVVLACVWLLVAALALALAGKIGLALLLGGLALAIALLILRPPVRRARLKAKARELRLGYVCNTRTYDSFQIRASDLRLAAVYGNSVGILLNLAPQLSAERPVLLFDVHHARLLTHVMPLSFVKPADKPLDPFKLRAEEACLVVEAYACNAPWCERVKLRELLLSYYEQADDPSMDDFLAYLASQLSVSDVDRYSIARVQSLCSALSKTNCFGRGSSLDGLPPSNLHFFLSLIPTQQARIAYFLTCIASARKSWGPIVAAVNCSAIPILEWGALASAQSLLGPDYSLLLLLEPGQANDRALSSAEVLFVSEIDGYMASYLRRRASLSEINLREGECLILHHGQARRIRMRVPIEPFLRSESRSSALERELGPDARLAYEILTRAQSVKATRPSLVTYCGEGTDVVIDKLISLSYLTIRTELIGDRYAPIVKVTPKGLAALREYGETSQRGVRLDELS